MGDPDRRSSANFRGAHVFRRRRGVLLTREAIGAGIHPRTLYKLRDAGVIEAVTRGDCFKFRHRIGLDLALEALRLYRSRRKQDLAALMRYAKVDRVDAMWFTAIQRFDFDSRGTLGALSRTLRIPAG